MDVDDFTTAGNISKYVKKRIDRFRNDPSKKDEVVNELKEVFSNDSPYRIKVLDGNEFVVVFRNILGKKRLLKLMIILNEIDPKRFKEIEW